VFIFGAEFNQQARKESDNGLNCGAPFMKHPAQSAQALSMNVEFVDCVLMPLLGPLVNFLPQQQVRRREKREQRDGEGGY
jgi:hypothetical protein